MNATGECSVGPARALVDPHLLSLRVTDGAPEAGAGRIRGLSRIGTLPVAFLEDVPVEIHGHDAARGAIVEGRAGSCVQMAPVRAESLT